LLASTNSTSKLGIAFERDDAAALELLGHVQRGVADGRADLQNDRVEHAAEHRLQAAGLPVDDRDRVALGELLHLAHQVGALGAEVPQIALDGLFEDAHDARPGTLVAMAGLVEAIHISPEKSVLPHPVESIEVTGEGLEGDRYFGRGDITLIEAEALEGLREDTGIEVSPAEVRRQVLTRGVRLNDLLGKRFRVGEVEAVGAEWCEPCNHLEQLTAPGVLKGLVHRGGLRADIVQPGHIAVGDEVRDAGA
jgi:MOSC domain-containing protein